MAIPQCRVLKPISSLRPDYHVYGSVLIMNMIADDTYSTTVIIAIYFKTVQTPD